MRAVLKPYYPDSSDLPGQIVKERGFSVLEALVAMAILAAAMLPLLALQGQFVRNVESFERANVRISARENALAYLKTQNFFLRTAGEVQFDDTVMQWKATPVEAPRPMYPAVDSLGRFDLVLYDVEVVLTSLAIPSDTFHIRGMGWRPRWSLGQ